MKQRLNFSPDPFGGGRRPLLLLWCANLVCVLLLVAAGWHWFRLRVDNGAVHEQLAALKREQREVIQRHQRIGSEMEGLDLRQYRKQVLQYHGIQAAVTTHWGRLLDDLGALMPADVRLVSLRPIAGDARDRELSTAMHLSAEARTKEAELRFIEALQAQASFQDVRFENEDYNREGLAVAFEIRFSYRPAGS